MDRITRYQESVNKFIKNKSCINDLPETIKNNIIDLLSDFDHFVSILLLTILNNRGKKNNLSLHGYYMATGIELIMATIKILECEDYYKDKFDINQYIMTLPCLINLSLSQNIDSIGPHFTKDKTIKIFHKCTKLLNETLPNISKKINCDLTDDDNNNNNKNKKNDIIAYNFSNSQIAFNNISKFKKINNNDLDNYIKVKYGTVCQLALSLGWLMGGGNDSLLKNINNIGTNFAFMIKIANDFSNLEKDVLNCNMNSLNYVINNGIQYSFEKFIEYKQKFIEGCITIHAYTGTLRELTDMIENKIDVVIENTNISINTNSS